MFWNAVNEERDGFNESNLHGKRGSVLREMMAFSSSDIEIITNAKRISSFNMNFS